MKRPFEILAAGLVLGELTVYAGVPVKAAVFLTAAFSAVLLTAAIFLQHPGKTAAEVSGVLRFLRPVLPVFAAGFLLGALRLAAAQAPSPEEKRLDALTGKSVTQEVRIEGAERKADRLVLRSGNLQITVPAAEDGGLPDPDIGDTVSVTGKLSRFEPAMNPGQFDAALYYRAEGLTHRMYASDLVITERRAAPFRNFLYRLRNRLTGILSAACPETDAGFLNAALFGDRSGLAEDFYDLYRKNGIAHLLAISGLHTALLGLSLYHLLRKSGAGFFFSGILSGAALVFYGLLTGSGTGAVRAVLMLLLAFTASWLGRTYDLQSAACIASAAMLLASPYQLFQCGFQLSFLAVLSIGGPAAALVKSLFPEVWQKRRDPEAEAEIILRQADRAGSAAFGLRRTAARIAEAVAPAGTEERKLLRQSFRSLVISFLVSATVFLFLLPVTAYWFFAVPPWSVFLNLLVIPPMGCILWAGLAVLAFAGAAELRAASGGILRPLLLFLSDTAGGIVHRILQVYTLLCHAAERLPGSRILLGRPEPWQILLYYLFLSAAYLFLLRREEIQTVFRSCRETGRKGPAAAAVCLAAALLSVQPLRSRDPVVWFLCIGQGDSIVIEQGDSCVLIDGGSSSDKNAGKNILLPFLESRALASAEAVFITHADQDHTNALEYLLTEDTGFGTEKVILNAAAEADDVHYGELKREIREGTGRDPLYMAAGDRCGAFRCLSPERGAVYADTNRQSLVLLFTCGGRKCLFMGDADQETERRILGGADAGELADIDLLKAGHHGSDSASGAEFLEAVRPAVTVLSYGKNNRYGHPHRAVLERLEAAGTEIHKTAEEGAVRIPLRPKP